MPRKSLTRDGLSVREYVGYALGDTASNLFFKSFGIFFPYFYVDVCGLGPAAVATMMLVSRFWDATNDPIMGLIADRTKSRWGKFRPYLLWMAIPYGVAGYLMFTTPDAGPTTRLLYAYITYNLMMMAYTAINVPYSSLLGVISPSPRVRTMASSFRFAGAFTGGLIVYLSARPLVRFLGGGDETQGFHYMAAIFGALSVLMFWSCFATTRERVTPPPAQKTDVVGELRELARNRPWLILLFAAIFSTTFQFMRDSTTLFYFKYVMRDDGGALWFGWMDRFTIFMSLGAVCQILGAASLSLVAHRIDKGRAAALLSIATGVCYGVCYFLPPDSFALLVAINCVATFTMGPTSALVWAMYGDVADYGEWKFGRRSTGLIYSASLFALKTGSMAAGWLGPMIMHLTGFVRNTEQSASSLIGLTISFSLLPMLFAFLKGGMIWIYPLKQAQLEVIERDLAARRASGE